MTDDADVEASPRPFTLSAAVLLVSVEALAEAVAVSSRAELTTGLRVGLIACIALKWLFAWGVTRLRAGAALGLLLLQGTTVVAALGASEVDLVPRMALGATASTVLLLLLASLHAFPTPTLPKG